MVIPNVMLWMMKNAYEKTTIKKAAKLLRHLQRNCKENVTDPEAVKLTWIPVIAETDEEIKNASKTIAS